MELFVVRCSREYSAAGAGSKLWRAASERAVALEPDEAEHQFSLGQYL